MFNNLLIIFDLSDNFKIKPEQQEWIKNSITTIYELINNTPPDGVRFSEVVKNILQVNYYFIFHISIYVIS